MGKDIFKLLPVLDVASIRKMVRATQASPVVNVSLGPTRADWLSVRLGVVRDSSGRRQGYCVRVIHQKDPAVTNGSTKGRERKLSARARTA